MVICVHASELPEDFSCAACNHRLPGAGSDYTVICVNTACGRGYHMNCNESLKDVDPEESKPEPPWYCSKNCEAAAKKPSLPAANANAAGKDPSKIGRDSKADILKLNERLSRIENADFATNASIEKKMNDLKRELTQSIRTTIQQALSTHAASVKSTDGVTPKPTNPQTKVDSTLTSPPSEKEITSNGDKSPPSTSKTLQNATLKYRENISARMIAALENSSTADIVSLNESRKYLAVPTPFKGDARDWLVFEAEFYRHWDIGRYPAEDMMSKLRKWVQGDAHEHVRGFLTGATNDPEQVMAQLRRQFFRPKTMIASCHNDITSLPRMRNGDRDATVKLLQKVGAYINMHNQLGIPLVGPVDVEVENLLSTDAASEWQKHLHSTVDKFGNPTGDGWNEFHQVLEGHIYSLPYRDKPREGQSGSNNNQRHRSGKGNGHLNALQQQNNLSKPSDGKQSKKPRRCLYDDCAAGKIYFCAAFLSLTPEERREWVTKRQICLRCFRHKDHMAENCEGKIPTCKAKGCRYPKDHSTIVHVSDEKGANQITDQSVESTFPMIPIWVFDVDNNPIRALAFLDSGSNISVVSGSLFRKLKLPSSAYDLKLNFCVAGAHETDNNSRIFPLKIAAIDQPSQTSTITRVVSVKNLKLPRQTQDPVEIKQRHPWLKDVPLSAYKNEMPQILIGVKHANLLKPLAVVDSPDSPMFAMKTVLGWVLLGSDTEENPSGIFSHAVEASQELESEILTLEEMHNLVKNFINSDILSAKQLERKQSTLEDERVNEIQRRTMKLVDKRYQIGLYFRDDDIQLPDNYKAALRRLQAQEISLKRTGMIEWANNHMKLLLDSGFAREANDNDLNPKVPHKNVNYAIGFLVYNKNKSPPKPRWVSDTSCVFQGKSLNSALLKGPDNLLPLTQALFHFRERKIAVVCDVEKQFHQVLIAPEDQNCQRYLWRNCDTTSPPKIYVHQAMMFGPTDSPSKANAIRIVHSENSKREFPSAARVALTSMYMDDAFNSEDTVEEAIESSTQLIKMFDKISWKLTEFRSNSSKVLASLPKDRVCKNLAVELVNKETLETYKVLGICWDPLKDIFSFKVGSRMELREKSLQGYVPTKNELLSFVMSLFDPIGLIAHFTIRGRMLMQETWKAQTPWGEKIDAETNVKWVRWLKDFEQITKLEIPRSYVSNGAKILHIDCHAFCDASDRAYGAVVYFRYDYDDGTSSICLIVAKSKVAPTKYLSIPKLELNSAVLAATLVQHALAQHTRMKIRAKHYWTDSKTALTWITDPNHRAQQFTAPRIAFIRDATEMSDWHYVPSKENPADDMTKWNEIDFSKANQRFYEGPSWLKDDREKWPISEKATIAIINAEKGFDDPYYAGILSWVPSNIRANWRKYKWFVAVMMKTKNFLRFKIRKTNEKPAAEITRVELEQAEKFIIRELQWKVWPNVMATLVKNGTISSRSSQSLYRLKPFIGEDKLMRAWTRMAEETTIPYEKRFPVILPAKHEVSDAIITAEHQKQFHIGIATTVAQLREKYWIIHARESVKRISARCSICIELRARPYRIAEGPLPDFRLDSSAYPFQNTGCDVFGPLTVYTRKSKTKRDVNVVIFICLTTRMLHLKILDSMDANEMLLAIQEVQTRRGPIMHLYSDNGTNFRKSAKILADKDTRDLLLKHNIEWTFIPPFTPSFGGCWERLIREVKRALKTVMKNQVVSDKVLEGILLQVENNLNNRPLTHLPISTEDDEPLTPNYLVKLHPGHSIPLTGAGDVNAQLYVKKATFYSQKITQRWIKEAMPRITNNNSFVQRGESLSVGDLVIVVDHRYSPDKWQRGRVVHTYEGRDGYARVCDIKLKSGELLTRRSSKNLCKLKFDIDLRAPTQMQNDTMVIAAEVNGKKNFKSDITENPSTTIQKEENKKNILACEQNLIICEKMSKFSETRLLSLIEQIQDGLNFYQRADLMPASATRKAVQLIDESEDAIDKNCKRSIMIPSVPGYICLVELMVALHTAKMHPYWIKFNPLKDDKGSIYITFDDEVETKALLLRHRITLGQISCPILRTNKCVNYLREKEMHSAILNYQPNDDSNNLKVIFSENRLIQMSSFKRKLISPKWMVMYKAARQNKIMPLDYDERVDWWYSVSKENILETSSEAKQLMNRREGANSLLVTVTNNATTSAPVDQAPNDPDEINVDTNDDDEEIILFPGHRVVKMSKLMDKVLPLMTTPSTSGTAKTTKERRAKKHREKKRRSKKK